MKRLPDFLLALMIGGIVVQIWMATDRLAPAGEFRSAPPAPLDVGDTLRLVTGYTEPGHPDTVFLDHEKTFATVVYSYHPDCVHTRTLGPTWARHFNEVRSTDARVRRLAVTLANPSSALDFVDHFGWQVEALSVAGLTPLQPAYALVSRTPWVFVFDSHGVLRLHSHGSQLDQVEAAVSHLLLPE